MEITKIAKVGKEDKFAVFIDDVLKLFLSGQSVIANDLRVGLTISEEEISRLNNLADEDQLFLKALKYLNVRLRSEGEINQYLKRKGANKDQLKVIILRLKMLELINDEHFAKAFIHDKLLASPASRRKIAYELKKKQIAEDILETALNSEQISDQESLPKLITIKRRQTKYRDDLKLMHYLVRNGYNYSDVKKALTNYPSD